MGISIGLDLGTTYSVVCYKSDKFNFIKDETNNVLIPSVVCYNKDVFVGRDALDLEEDFPDKTIRSSKRYIGTDKIIHQENSLTAKDIATDILKYLKKITEDFTKETVDGLVITVPAYFNQNQRLETKQAAEDAGFSVLRIINEPTSAALAYGDDAQNNELVLIYDLGGGTFDVTLLQMTGDNVYQVISTSGDTKLGGDDFDSVIIELFKDSLPENFKPFKDFDVRLKKFAEEIKIQLNYKNVVTKTLKYSGTIDQKIYHHKFEITLDKYLECIDVLLKKTKSHVLNTLNDGDKKISQLDKIILVGGSTKSKHVRNFVEAEFNTKVFYDIDPDLTVAAGAANLARSITQQNSDGALLIDVTPLSLGIETKGGLLNKIIPRNTNIPISSGQDFITAEDNQDRVNIRIYQGERPLAKDNEFLGEFELSGFEKRPKGQTKIFIKFDIDASGLIQVSAFDKISGAQSNVILKPLASDRINNLLDDLEMNNSNDEQILIEQELDNLNKQVSLLILTKSLKGEDVSELKEMHHVMKSNISALKTLIQSLTDA